MGAHLEREKLFLHGWENCAWNVNQKNLSLLLSLTGGFLATAARPDSLFMPGLSSAFQPGKKEGETILAPALDTLTGLKRLKMSSNRNTHFPACPLFFPLLHSSRPFRQQPFPFVDLFSQVIRQCSRSNKCCPKIKTWGSIWPSLIYRRRSQVIMMKQGSFTPRKEEERKSIDDPGAHISERPQQKELHFAICAFYAASSPGEEAVMAVSDLSSPSHLEKTRQKRRMTLETEITLFQARVLGAKTGLSMAR